MLKDMYIETIKEWLSEIGVKADHEKVDDLAEGLLVCDEFLPPVAKPKDERKERIETLEKKVDGLTKLLREKGHSVYAGDKYISEFYEEGLGTLVSTSEKKHVYK